MCDAQDPDVELEVADYFPLEFTLPVASQNCPVCGAKTRAKTYHSRGYLQGICAQVLGYPQIEHLGPHFDRTCHSCSAVWCEQAMPTREQGED